MTLTPGPAPIVDFDGTIAALPVDWAGLRRRLGVSSIDDLWRGAASDPWGPVTDAEVAAAVEAEPVGPMVAALEAARGFAVLTSNSEQAVHRFLARFPVLAAKVRLVAGREALGGSKRDLDRFRVAFTACRESTAADRGGGPVVYVGDAQFELEFASGLGAVAVHVADLAL